MPGQSLTSYLLEEGIWVKLLDVEDASATPQTLGEHQRTRRSGYTRRVADPLRAGLTVGCLVRAVVPYIVGALLAVLDATDAAADRGLTRIVLAQLLRIG